MEQVYIVATTNNDGESDYFQDIILVTKSKTKAQRLTRKLLNGKSKLCKELPDYEGATWFTRKLEDISLWKESD